MRLTRAALLVAATALTPALLATTPAFATGTAAVPTAVTATSETPVEGTPVGGTSEEDDRVAVFRILHLAQQNGDRAVIREANEALDDGSPEALRAFLETGYRLAQAEDDRVAVARILADPTISAALRAAAEEVIDGTPEELRYFLEVGRYQVDTP